MNNKITEAAQKIKIWRKDPIKFVVDNFGVEPDKWQRNALEAFRSQERERIRISLQACA